MYYIFIFSFYSKLISDMNDYDVDWEHIYVYFCAEILTFICSTRYNIL